MISYNSGDVVEACLAALSEFAPSWDVLVVDNASSDDTVERVRTRGTRVIANRENRGFAGAVNQAFRETQSELVLILNPDVELRSSLEPLAEACRNAGVAGGRLTDATGTNQTGFTIRRLPTATVLALELLGVNRIWPGNRWNRKYRYLDRDLESGGPAEQPAGAFLMIRRDACNTLGGFDESFHPVWFEDVDFCARAKAAGYEIQYVPEAVGRHLGGHSIQKIDESSRQLYWYDSLIRYAGKHLGVGGYRVVCIAAGLGVIPRSTLRMFQTGSLRPASNCFRILKFVGRRLVSGPPSGLAQRPGIDN
ncbi:MAG: glycosyltransferase family 2 protein [Acidobacteriota bacterium]